MFRFGTWWWNWFVFSQQLFFEAVPKRQVKFRCKPHAFNIASLVTTDKSFRPEAFFSKSFTSIWFFLSELSLPMVRSQYIVTCFAILQNTCMRSSVDGLKRFTYSFMSNLVWGLIWSTLPTKSLQEIFPPFSPLASPYPRSWTVCQFITHGSRRLLCRGHPKWFWLRFGVRFFNDTDTVSFALGPCP